MKITGLLFFLVPLNIYCQDLTGTWIGRETGSSYFKLVILQLGDSCFGYTYDEGPGFCQANFAGKLDKEKQKLKGKGINFIARSSGHVLGVYNLSYSKEGENEYLEGSVGAKGTGAAILSMGMISFAQLKKITSQVDTTRFMIDKRTVFQNRDKQGDKLGSGTIVEENKPEVKEKDSAARINGTRLADTTAYAKKARISKLVQHIYTNADTVKIMLYDNGVVDDDTVTVFFDNTVVLDRYRITEKAKELDIFLSKDGQPHILELFANNLGSIPPNTALIVVMAGKERYEVHASYDLSTNAQIILQYKE